jgi:hypothetical protein
MRWQPVAMPPSAAALLNKARAGRGGQSIKFSRTQEFVAALCWFATFPLETRLKIAHEFGIHLATQDQTKTDSMPSVSVAVCGPPVE